MLGFVQNVHHLHPPNIKMATTYENTPERWKVVRNICSAYPFLETTYVFVLCWKPDIAFTTKTLQDDVQCTSNYIP